MSCDTGAIRNLDNVACKHLLFPFRGLSHSFAIQSFFLTHLLRQYASPIFGPAKLSLDFWLPTLLVTQRAPRADSVALHNTPSQHPI